METHLAGYVYAALELFAPTRMNFRKYPPHRRLQVDLLALTGRHRTK